MLLTFQIVPSLYLKTTELIGKLQYNVDEAIGHITDDSDYTIYTGYCGIALYHFNVFRRNGNKKSYEIAKSLALRACKNLNGKRISFLTGDSGPLALATIFHIRDEEHREADKTIDRLIQLGNSAPESTPDEILYGWSGYVYALTFVNMFSTTSVIPEKDILNALRRIMRNGVCLAQRRGVKFPPLMWEWHNKNYLGAAHGVAGILYTLLKYNQWATDHEKNNLIKPTLDWLVTQRYDSGNFMSSDSSSEDRLVQWCHGAPGFTSLLILASESYGDESYLKLALETGDITWNRGLIKKGYSLCHGVAGNAYAFVELFKKTKEPRDLYRAAAFMEWCLSYPKCQGLKPDRPYSLYEGIMGLLYFLTDLKNPLDAAFPGFD
ncbi:hypothetical protein GE061_014516 [Apolygus lucorum]|uniref:LanC-like protein 2 n=1 Tax=Apolygus lucorum TaxID=248454 RepID=A0A8S9XL61_APOLU|nr:hypothetical protein GE061_014516 [Apolygus lucorum]